MAMGKIEEEENGKNEWKFVHKIAVLLKFKKQMQLKWEQNPDCPC